MCNGRSSAGGSELGCQHWFRRGRLQRVSRQRSRAARTRRSSALDASTAHTVILSRRYKSVFRPSSLLACPCPIRIFLKILRWLSGKLPDASSRHRNRARGDDPATHDAREGRSRRENLFSRLFGVTAKSHRLFVSHRLFREQHEATNLYSYRCVRCDDEALELQGLEFFGLSAAAPIRAAFTVLSRVSFINMTEVTFMEL